jgi:hypothetical protein
MGTQRVQMKGVLPWFVNLLVALIKKKRKFSSYIRKFGGIGCKVIYD